MRTARKNVEFEAKVIQDIITMGHPNGGATIGSIGQSTEFQDSYYNWIWDIIEQGLSEHINRFQEFCNSWTGYGGSYDPDFIPQTIVKYFN